MVDMVDTGDLAHLGHGGLLILFKGFVRVLSPQTLHAHTELKVCSLS